MLKIINLHNKSIIIKLKSIKKAIDFVSLIYNKSDSGGKHEYFYKKHI